MLPGKRGGREGTVPNFSPNRASERGAAMKWTEKRKEITCKSSSTDFIEKSQRPRLVPMCTLY